MLEEFRQQASFEEEPEAATPETRTRHEFLGLTPGQRLVIAVMLLFITLALSTLCLMVTEKIILF